MVSSSPPKAPPIAYTAPHGTRWQKEKAQADAQGSAGLLEPASDPKTIGPWILGECVGKGASGRVRIAKHRTTGVLAAVKILPLAPLHSSRHSLATQKSKEDKLKFGIDREITMMKLMDHPNILRIYDVFEGKHDLYLVLEYVPGGELFDFLVNRGRLPIDDARAIFMQIVHGLAYAHAFSIIHRDLKPENILLRATHPHPLVAIADWGMAAFAPPARALETSCGSPHYASPEIVAGARYEGTATDIWSCGVILYALLTGRLPFDDKNVRALLAKVKLGRYEIPAYVDPMAKDLLTRMLVVDVSQRINMAAILAHPFLSPAPAHLVYVPAPPVATLAQPLPSPAHIDPDLLASLGVIWGRAADPRQLASELLSPPGQGTLPKALYFLLRTYRDRQLQSSSAELEEDDEEEPDPMHEPKQYIRPVSAFVDTRAVDSMIRATRDAPPPPCSSPRPRPNSPGGPRPRPTSTPVQVPAPIPIPVKVNAPPPAYQPTVAGPRERPMKRPRAMTAMPTPVQATTQVHAPAPVRAQRRVMTDVEAAAMAQRVAAMSIDDQDGEQEQNKENYSFEVVDRSEVPSMGVRGLGVEMGNTMSTGGTEKEDKKEGKRRVRPPTMDFRGIKRSPNPSPGTTPSSGTSSSTHTPALGEVKGWFSHLFAWKPAAHAAHSHYVLPARDIARRLARIGVRVRVDGSVLRCESADGATRFRVEGVVGDAGRVVLVQEKGALRGVWRRLREDVIAEGAGISSA